MRKAHFSDFQLDLELFELRRNGQIIEIGSRTLNLLVCLIENRGRVVTREELRKKVWDSAALSRSSIPTCVRELRISLDDDAAHPQFIETTRGHGYRFIGELTSIDLREQTRPETIEKLPFSGRSHELSELGRHLCCVTSEAKFRVLLIKGAAGIGKTRLLEKFFQDLPKGIKTYSVNSPDLDHTPTLWPWIQIAKQMIADLPQGSELESLLSSAAFSIEIAPHPGQNDFERSGSADHHLVLETWARSILAAIQGRPAVIAIEDIHQADSDSLKLIRWLSHDLSEYPILLIATHRPLSKSEDIAHQISKIDSANNSQPLQIGPLSAFDIEGMLDPLLFARDKTALALHSRTSGNPSFITHLIRCFGQQKIAESPASILNSFPPDASAIVARQLNHMSKPCLNALSCAAVIGHSFTGTDLAETLRIDVAMLEADLDSARSSDFLSEDEAGYRFENPFIRDALYESLTTSARKRFHLSYAEVLRRRTENPAIVAEIAEHLHQALPMGDPSDAAHALKESGEQSAARFDFTAAQRSFRLALRASDLDPKATVPERCELLLRLAQTSLYLGDRKQFRSTLIEVADQAKKSHLETIFTNAAIQLAPDFLSIEVGVHDSFLISLLKEALEKVPTRDCSLKTKLLSKLSLAHTCAGKQEIAFKISAAAIDLSHQTKDPEAIVQALSARSDALHGLERLKDRAAAVQDLGIAAGRTKSLPDKMMHLVREVSLLLESGEIEALDLSIDACDRVASDLGIDQYLWYPIAFRAMRAAMLGDLTAAAENSQKLVSIAEKTKNQNAANTNLYQSCHLLVEQDLAQNALPPAISLARENPSARPWKAAIAWLHNHADDAKAARRILDAFEISAYPNLSREVGGSAGIAFLAYSASKVGTHTQKRALYEICSRGAKQGTALGFGMMYLGAYARYAGLLAASLGDVTAAKEHLRGAIELEMVRGALICGANAQLDLAQIFQSQKTDEAEFRQLVVSARQIASTLELPRLRREVESLDSEDE